jgi:hypothetical protein
LVICFKNQTQENPMHACSDAQLPMDLLTDVEKYGGIFELLVRTSIKIKYRRKLPTEFNPAQKNIILFFVGNSAGKIIV